MSAVPVLSGEAKNAAMALPCLLHQRGDSRGDL
jgi:hypothetical protein